MKQLVCFLFGILVINQAMASLPAIGDYAEYENYDNNNKKTVEKLTVIGITSGYPKVRQVLENESGSQTKEFIIGDKIVLESYIQGKLDDCGKNGWGYFEDMTVGDKTVKTCVYHTTGTYEKFETWAYVPFGLVKYMKSGKPAWFRRILMSFQFGGQ